MQRKLWAAYSDQFAVHPSERWSGYHHLCCGVLRRAALDAKAGNGWSEDAREWLRSSPWAVFYLSSIGLDDSDAARYLDGLDTG